MESPSQNKEKSSCLFCVSWALPNQAQPLQPGSVVRTAEEDPRLQSPYSPGSDGRDLPWLLTFILREVLLHQLSELPHTQANGPKDVTTKFGKITPNGSKTGATAGRET